MPKIQYTQIRNGIYHLRVRIPTDLVDAFGRKEYTKSLDTSNPNECKDKVSLEMLRLRADFKSKRRELQYLAKPSPNRLLSDLSEIERASLAIKWLIENDNEEKLIPRVLPQDDTYEDVEETLLENKGDYAEEIYQGTFNSGQRIAKYILKKQNIDYAPKSKEFWDIAELFSRAGLELSVRALQRHQGKPVKGADHLFSEVNQQQALSLPGQKRITFGEMCEEFRNIREPAIKPNSVKGLRHQIKILKDLISPDTYLLSISPAQCIEVYDLIKSIPLHAYKKYGDINIRKAIELGRKDKAPVLHLKTANTTFDRLSQILKLAAARNYIIKSPANEIKTSFKKKQNPKPRRSFQIDDLNLMFNTPLYKARMDKQGKDTLGKKKPYSTKFWLPLIALWSGMRLE